MRTEMKKPLLIAHRGASGHERENTVAAFLLAGKGACYGIETDVHVTADEQFIIIHDDGTTRVAGETLLVEQTNFERLRRVRLFAHNSTEEKQDDLLLPTVEEYISACRAYNKKAILELKNPMKKEYIAALVKKIDNLGFQEEMVYISFSLDNMIALRELLPTASLQYLVGEIKDENMLLQSLAEYKLDLDINYGILSDELIEKVHALGRQVNVWTVNDPEVYRKLCARGVDYVTTNFPEEMNAIS